MGKKQIEYIVISESNFIKLKQISKSSIELDKQVYEDIPGFESLRIIFKNNVQRLVSLFPLFIIQSFIFIFLVIDFCCFLFIFGLLKTTENADELYVS